MVSASGYPALEVASQELEVTAVDMTEMICPREECAAVTGNVLVYRDSTHIIATYSRTLSSSLETDLRGADQLRFGR